MSSKLQHVFKTWNDAGKLSFIAVDEAHCIDSWGNSFRPDFLRLGDLNGFSVPMVALTGTATERVKSCIESTLGMDNPNSIQVNISRTNLFLQIDAKKDKPVQQIVEFIKTNFPGEKGIVHCSRRKDTVNLAHNLASENIHAVFVHGSLPDAERKKYEQAWSCGTAKVICATKSFGMGIDNKNVRFVIHLSFPESIEDYVQKVGRAGRDGSRATCLLLFDHKDRSFHLHNILQIENKEHMAYKYNLMNKMVEYCVAPGCRHKQLMNYFGDDCQVCDENCDNCTSEDPSQPQDFTFISCLLIQGLQRLQQVHKKVNVLILTQFAMGSSTVVLKQLALDKDPEFGSLKCYFRYRNGRKYLQSLIYQLIIMGKISELPVGNIESPQIEIKTGNVDSLLSGSERIVFAQSTV